MNRISIYEDRYREGVDGGSLLRRTYRTGLGASV